MNRITFRACLLTTVAAAALFSANIASAGAVERSLLGVHIYSNVRVVLKRFGNPTYVLTSGQTFSTTTNSIVAVPSGSNGPVGALPPLQPNSAGPVAAFGMGGADQDNAPSPAAAPSAPNGEVTLVFQKSNGVTYQFLLSPSGSVIQITALGYADAATKTSREVTFGSSYSQVINRYGYPEDQSEANGVAVLDYSKRAHVAFELLNNEVVGIVVAAVS
jgi:hypothetical protein